MSAAPGAPASTSTAAVTTAPSPARAQEAVPVTLQTEPEPTVSEAPARSEAMARAWRQASDQYCGQVGEWARRLTADGGKLEDFQRASQVLAGVSTTAPYPAARAMAQRLLSDRVKWNDPVTDWTYKMGAVEGPAYYVAEIARQASSIWQKSWFSEESHVSEFVHALGKVCREGPVPADALKAVAHSAYVWQQRADRVMEPEIRAKEPVEFDRTLADKCVSTVEGWWRAGQVEVRQDGRPVPFTFDLSRALRRERVAVTEGGIDLRTMRRACPPAVVARAVDICKSSWKSKDEPVSKGLAALRALDAERATEVAGVIADLAEASGHSDNGALGRLMIEGASDPSIQERFRPHLPRIRAIVSDAHSRGVLATDNLVGCARAEIVAGIHAMFPEMVNESFVQSELAPLLAENEPNTQRRAAEVAIAILERRPELSNTVADGVLSKDGARDAPCWGVLETAVQKHGWVPSTDQMTEIARSAWVPLTRDGYSIFGGTVGADNFRAVLRLLSALKQHCPQVLEGVQIPDTRFNMVPLADGVYDRLWNDPNDDPVRRLHGKSGSDNGISSLVYSLAFPDAARTDSMLATIAAAVGQGQRLPGETSKPLDKDIQKAIVVLMSAPLDAAQRARLEAVVQPQVYERQGHYAFEELMEPLRKRASEAALARMGTETAASDVLKTAGELFLLRRCSKDASFSTPSGRQTKLEGEVRDAISRLPADDLARARAERLDALKAQLAGKPLETFSNREVADLQLLLICADADPSFDPALRDALRPHASSKLYDNRITPLLKELRKEERQLNLDRAISSAATPGDRVSMVAAYVESAKLEFLPEPAARAEALAAFAKGTASVDGLGDMASVLRTPENVFTAYADLARDVDSDAAIADAWPRFKDIITRVGGDRFLENPKHLQGALDVHRYVEERTAAGESREVALEHGLGCHLMGWDPRTTPSFQDALGAKEAGRVEQQADGVRIGGVLIPKKIT